MIVKFYDIDWDIDNSDYVDDYVDVEAPDVPPPTQTTLTVEDGLDVENDGADILSDIYGWCVNSFKFDIQ